MSGEEIPDWAPQDDPSCAFALDVATAESAAEEAVESIIHEGGRLIYAHYLQRKAFPFAASAICDVLLSHVDMCFVRMDEGERGRAEQWALEAEPKRPPIDTWARGAVEVRRREGKAPKAIGATQDETTTPSSTRSPKGRRDMREREKDEEVLETEEKPPPPVTMPIEWRPGAGVDGWVRGRDSEEDALRDMKERETRRRKDEEARLKKKKQEDEEEQARLAKLKAELKHKPYTFDSDGNLIMVSPVMSPERLPPQNVAVNYRWRATEGGDGAKEAKAKKNPDRRTVGREEERKAAGDEEAVLVRKSKSRQPPAIETMQVAPGVALSEGGRMKKGPEPSPDPRHLSRKDYERLVESFANMSSSLLPSSFQPIASVASPLMESIAEEQVPVGMESWQETAAESASPTASVRIAEPAPEGAAEATVAAAQAASTLDRFNAAIVNAKDWGVNPPAKGSKKTQPSVPTDLSNTQFVKLKKDALGDIKRRLRDRSNEHSGPFKHQPPPPPGAARSHPTVAEMQERFFLPHIGGQPGEETAHTSVRSAAPSPDLGLPIGGEGARMSPPMVAGRGKGRGGIKTNNPELARRLLAGTSQ